METTEEARGGFEVDYKQLHQELMVTKSALASSKQMIKTLEKELEYKTSILNEANTKLKKYNDLLISSQKMAKIGAWEINLDNMECFWSREVYKIHEVPFDTKIGVAGSMEFYHPEDRGAIQSAINEAMTEIKPFDLELRIRTAKSNVVWVRCIGVPATRDGKVNGLQGVFQNIDFKKKTEEALRESKELFKHIFENAALGVALVDAEGKPMLANQSLQKILGYTDQELEKMHFADFTHPEDVDKDMKLYKELVTGEIQSYRIEKRYIRKDGHTVWAILSVSLIHDEFNSPKYAIGIVEDVTAEKLNEAKLEKTRESLKEKNSQLQKTTRELDRQLKMLACSNQELEEFAYIASHDLQEPLRLISSYSQLLKNKYGTKIDSEGQEFVSFILEGAQRMQKLIRDLLGYSKLGRNRIKYEWVDLPGIIQNIRDNLKLKIEYSGAEIHFEGVGRMMADTVQLQQLLQNLISNSIKYCRKDENPHVFVSTEEKDSHWLIKVADNGIGIEKEYTDKVFQVFKRLHPKERYEGTGIGLAICKKIVEKHRGRIWLNSVPGKGTVFYFTISKK